MTATDSQPQPRRERGGAAGRRSQRQAGGAAVGRPTSCAASRPTTCFPRRGSGASRPRPSASWPRSDRVPRRPGDAGARGVGASSSATTPRRSSCGAGPAPRSRACSSASRRGCSTRSWRRAGRIRPARAQSGAVGADRRQVGGLLARLRLALRDGPRPRAALRHDRGLPELHQAGAGLALAAPLRRHDLRADRRGREQAPPRHGLQPHPLFRPGVHGLGHRRGAGRGFDRDGAAGLRARVRRRELRDPRQRQRELAAGLGRHDDEGAARLCARQPGGGGRALHPRRRDGAGDECRGDRAEPGRDAGRLRAQPSSSGAARR